MGDTIRLQQGVDGEFVEVRDGEPSVETKADFEKRQENGATYGASIRDINAENAESQHTATQVSGAAKANNAFLALCSPASRKSSRS